MAFNPDNDVLNNVQSVKPLVRASIQKILVGKSVNGLFQKNVQFVNKDNQQAQ